MRITILSILILASSISLFAQRRGGNGGKRPSVGIKGRVIDQSTNQPLEFATISIHSKKDSSLVSGGMTDMDGSFDIQAPAGRYYGTVEFIGFAPMNVDIPFERGQRAIELGDIIMEASGVALDDVEIRAARSETVMTLDKRVFNVGSDLANRGGSAQDVLDNVPSVTVDIDGGVSLRGSSGVRILINGRPSGLAGAGNANGLRSIPSNMIESVEVITNPSARYEAEGMAGIINIILKKEERGGFNGSFDLNAGYPYQAGVGANVNYRKGNINWFANYGLSYRESVGGGESFATIETADGKFIQEQIQDRDRGGISNSVRAGIDYYFNDNENITGSFLYRISDEDNLAQIQYRDFLNTVSNKTGETLRTDDEREDESRLQYSVNYLKKLGKKNHQLKASVQYRDEIETEASDFLERYLISADPINDLQQRSNNDELQRNWLFQVDYEMPLGSDGKFEIGGRSSLRDIGNEYLVEELQGESWSTLEGLSNDFNYDENIHAAYGIVGNKSGKVSYQVGLRAELSHVITELLQSSDPANDRKYTNLFPSGHVSYELAEGSSVQASYSRRLRRPRFFDLNPFFTFSDSRNVFRGNPNLDPELTNSYEVSYLKIWEQLTLSSSVYHRYTTDVIQRVLTFNPDGTTLRQPENLATRKNYGAELTFSYSGIDWMRLDGNFNAYQTSTDGGNVSQELQASDFTWFSRLTSRFTFWNRSNLQLRFNYRAPVNTTQGVRKSIATLDLGFSKDLSKNTSLTIGVRDLFNSRKRRSITEGEGFYRESTFQWRGRTGNISLNYRINQKKKRSRGGSGGDYEGGEGEF